MKTATLLIPLFLLTTISCSLDSEPKAAQTGHRGADSSPATSKPPAQAEAGFMAPQGSLERAEMKSSSNTTVDPSSLMPIALEDADKSNAAAEAYKRRVIRDAEITIEAEDTVPIFQKVSAIAEANGGYVVVSNTTSGGASPTIQVKARVPSERFGDAVDAIRNCGGKVAIEKISGQDVTEEYVDLQARIKTSESLEAQFLEIMKRASTISETMQIQREIATVRTEIERLEARRRVLENQSSLSSISVTVQPPLPIAATTKEGFSGEVMRALGEGVDTSSAILLFMVRGLGYAIPVIVLILLPLLVIGRLLSRRLRDHRKAEPQTT